ncbi:site-specific integrase [Halobiforma nitratireducens]|uniref:Phage integrase n=1 Tax=Halobiforma nitratireducens JCM 10879 TaxID=1227454 RepID=M0M464_9EURY|nr:site-specific integrase [Halobiforma nitratireducens]EMA39160.1 phage integrase [Halobiforma nitratireducens JCM 10879]
MDREDIPTKDEVKQLMSAALNDRDRAIIAVLADTGMRLKELRYLQRKDVEFDKAGIAVMTPTAKQGVENPRDRMRRNRLTFSRPAMQTWYENHPRVEPDAALFCRLRSPYTDVTARGLQAMFYRLVDRAGLPAERQDRLSLHKFRHLSITEDRQKAFMRDSYVAKKHGHVDTTMLRRYDHLTSDDVDKAQVKAMVERGDLPPDALTEIEGGENGEDALNLVSCPNCGHAAAPDKALCPRCNQALDADTADKLDQLLTALRNYMDAQGVPDEIADLVDEDTS